MVDQPRGARPVGRLAIVAAGVAATTVAAIGAMYLFVLAVMWGCGGSDASSPSRSDYCTGPLDPELPIAAMVAGTAAPALGTVVGAVLARWWPFVLGVAIEVVAAAVGIAVLMAI